MRLYSYTTSSATGSGQTLHIGITIENYLDFEAFKDFELNVEDYERKSKSMKLNVNASAWNKLFDRLLIKYFNDYAYDKQCSGSKIARFSKQIVRNWKLCIEYDKNIVSKSKRSRFFEFPLLRDSSDFPYKN